MNKTMNQKIWTTGKQGFTLIELLVVISIIGLLVSFGAARYLTAEKGARDARRKSDLNQYRTALESYANANGSVYPEACGHVNDTSSLCDGDFKTDYLSGACLQDPTRAGTTSDYYYCSNASQYALWAKLEGADNTYYLVCSNGRTGNLVSENAPSVTSGNCPL
jgi:prepilin-type N-terminal cleavage/methylation domain-containing protein